MHYKNGREAKNGDKVLLIPSYGNPMVGILYDATANNDYCNGKLAPISVTDACPNLKECLLLSDAMAAVAGFLAGPVDATATEEGGTETLDGEWTEDASGAAAFSSR